MAAIRPAICVFAIAIIFLVYTMQGGKSSDLNMVLQSRFQAWKAVANFEEHKYVAGPRWVGLNLPQLSVINAQGKREAYPDVAWNAWKPESDSSNTFINITALRLEGELLWVVDNGVADFGDDSVSGGAKIVAIDLVRNKVVKNYNFSDGVAKPGSYINDVRFQDNHAFLTDAGNARIIVVDLRTGDVRRVLHASNIQQKYVF